MGAFRFGPASPSIVYRSMRQLEPSLSSPALHLPRTACQMHAKQYLGDVRDRSALRADADAAAAL